MITPELLMLMGASSTLAHKYAPYLDQAATEFNITNPLDIAHWLAQIFQESGALRFVREIWDGKGAQARYDTRTDLGNTPQIDGDGYHNRGVGLIQITGEYNIERTLAALGYPPNSNSNLESPSGASRSAAFFWKDKKLSAIALASGTDVSRCTKHVNGGYTHLKERQAYFDKAYPILKDSGQQVDRMDKNKDVLPHHDEISRDVILQEPPSSEFVTTVNNRENYL